MWRSSATAPRWVSRLRVCLTVNRRAGRTTPSGICSITELALDPASSPSFQSYGTPLSVDTFGDIAMAEFCSAEKNSKS